MVPGIIDPLRAAHLVEVDDKVFGNRPQPLLGVVPGRYRKQWRR
jgi:hypothetical protein